jgi:hypothetical protein
MCCCCTGYGSDRVRRRTKNDSNESSSNGSRHTPSHLGAQQLSQVAEAAVDWLSNAAAAAQAALPSAANGLTSSCLRKWLWAYDSTTSLGVMGGGGGVASSRVAGTHAALCPEQLHSYSAHRGTAASICHRQPCTTENNGIAGSCGALHATCTGAPGAVDACCWIDTGHAKDCQPSPAALNVLPLPMSSSATIREPKGC